ncbi:MAG: exodeoxyribonuclease VII small subunit [Clostridiales bacterium]|nr:exodeoxyribonuclease VII small subunit [Clostridiales bacterium]
MSYEENIKRLQEIVELLEGDNQSLDNNVKLYEEAVELIKNSYEEIKLGKGKIVKITDKLEEIDLDLD